MDRWWMDLPAGGELRKYIILLDHTTRSSLSLYGTTLSVPQHQTEAQYCNIMGLHSVDAASIIS